MSVADRQPAMNAGADEDVARVETVLPISGSEVEALLGDVERLLRLNPLLAIERWDAGAGGCRLVGNNESNGRSIDTEVHVERSPGGLALHYASGLKRATRLVPEPHPAGVNLVVSEHYPRLADALDPRLAEVDKSLVPWVAAIRRHLLARRRWGWLPGWRWWQEHVLLSLPPRGRRIVRLLVWLTALEFALFLVAVAALRLTP